MPYFSDRVIICASRASPMHEALLVIVTWVALWNIPEFTGLAANQEDYEM
jgi:hypothetical protein